MYYKISSMGDGGYIEELTQKKLEKELNDYVENFDIDDYNNSIIERDLNYWKKPYLLIKGKIVTPKIKKVVKVAKKIVKKVEIE